MVAMILSTNAPLRGARLRRTPTKRSPTTSVSTQNNEEALTSTSEYDKDSKTEITRPQVSDSFLDAKTLHNNTSVASVVGHQRTTNTSPDKPVPDTDFSTHSFQQVTETNVPEETSGTTSSPSTASDDTTSTPAIKPPVREMKILKLANAVDVNKQQGCFSSDGNRQGSSRTSLSSDCRQQHQHVDTAEKIKLSLVSTVSLKQAANHAASAGTETGLPVLQFGFDGTSAMPNGRSAFGGGSLHGGVNILLGGAMLSGLILLFFFICYCCQRSARKHEQNCPLQHWIQDPEAQLEVFTLDGQRIDRTVGTLAGPDTMVNVGAYLNTNTPSPPPPYQAVVCKSAAGENGDLGLTGVCDLCDDPLSDGLPTYEAALKLEAVRKV